VISSILGPAPVIDFDGTLARLSVPWGDLRDSLDVDRIDDLWERHDAGAWGVVRTAEVDAATRAQPVPATVDALGGVVAFAVLTSNSEAAVTRFLARYPRLAARVGIVVGRERLGGPKTTFDVFARGLASCRLETAGARGDGPLVYLGDRDFELKFAARLGAVARHVGELAPDSSSLTRPH
jgi:hypothetical protein